MIQKNKKRIQKNYKHKVKKDIHKQNNKNQNLDKIQVEN